MATTNRGRPAKSKDAKLGHYTGVRYDEELRRRIEDHIRRLPEPIPEAMFFRLAARFYLDSQTKAK